jgi:hypothetical protein
VYEVSLFLKTDHLDVWPAHIQYNFEDKYFVCGAYAVLGKD